MPDRNVTNNGLYDFINAMRLELKADITRVEDKVDKVKDQVNKNEVKQTVTATKLVMLIGSITVVVSAVVTVAVERLIK